MKIDIVYVTYLSNKMVRNLELLFVVSDTQDLLPTISQESGISQVCNKKGIRVTEDENH